MNLASVLEDDSRLLIVGAARSGVAAALAARRMLPGVEVAIADRESQPEAVADAGMFATAGITLELGREDFDLLDGCGLVVKSPGVPADIALLEEARRRGIPVWGEIEFAWRFLKNFIVGVTGTNGKTTTTELIAHILNGAGMVSRAAGNVGTALSSLVGEIGEDEVIVLELSSFQLEDAVEFRPDVAILLNLSEDHLDRHGDAECYYSAKMSIFANQQPQDLSIINLDNPICRRPVPVKEGKVWFSASAGDSKPTAGEHREPLVFVRGGVIRANLAGLAVASEGIRSRLPAWYPAGAARGEPAGQAGDGAAEQAEPQVSGADGRNGPARGEDSRKAGSTEIIAWREASLKGEHNLDNSLAATAACLCLGLTPEEVASGLRSFPGVPHRLQHVGVVDGVTYVNDSKATNVDAAIKALTAFEGGIHLILGGSLKGCSFDPLAEAAAARKVREIIIFGEAAEEIGESFQRAGRETFRVDNLEQAVDLAAADAAPGDVVLLAPACASFDQYENYEERGEHFISLVGNL